MGWLRELLRSIAARRPPLLHVAIDVGDGPPVVMLHGIASSSVTFQRLVPLVEPHHRVIAIDLLGFGESPAPDDSEYTMEQHTAALARSIRALRLRKPFVLVGHSMGALIASRYTAMYGSKVKKLVLVSPPLYLPTSSIGVPGDRTAMGAYFRLYEFLRENKDFTIRAAAGLARLSPIKNLLDVSERNWRAFVLSLQNSIEAQTTLADLATVSVPVELIYGALDPLLAPVGIKMAGQLRNVTVHRVEGGDHVIRTRLARVVATAIG